MRLKSIYILCIGKCISISPTKTIYDYLHILALRLIKLPYKYSLKSKKKIKHNLKFRILGKSCITNLRHFKFRRHHRSYQVQSNLHLSGRA